MDGGGTGGRKSGIYRTILVGLYTHKVAVIIYSMIKYGEAFRGHVYSQAIRDFRFERHSREIRRTLLQNLLLTNAGMVEAESGTVEVPWRALVL